MASVMTLKTYDSRMRPTAVQFGRVAAWPLAIIRCATIESPPTRASGTQDVLILIAVLDFRVVLYPEPSTPDVQAVHTVHSTGNLVEAAGKHRGWIEVLRSVRVVIDRRQIGARADCRECRADAQDLVSHSDLS